MSRSHRIAVLSWLVVGACADPVPETPTWFGDVQPILAANCARCHGATPEQDSIAGFRLDRYVAGDDATLDAYDYRESIVRQAVARVAPVMPPAYELSDRQRDVLERWVAADAPKGSRDNALPTAMLMAPATPPTMVDQELALTLESLDADGDGLSVGVGVRDLGTGEAWAVVGGLGAGLRDLRVDTGQLASLHDFEVSAIVDDGYADDPAANLHQVVLIPSLRVDHGARGTAPTVRVVEPNGGQTVIGMTTIAWNATDPDAGDTLTIDLDLVRVAPDGTRTVAASIARGLSGVSTYDWDPAGVPATDGGGSIPYLVRATATDGAMNRRSDDSDATFTLTPPVASTDLTWADVKPLFVTYCAGCHGQPARTVALEYFRLDKYDADDPEAPTNGDLGVYEQRALVYERLVTQGNMPPAAASQPSAADVARIAEWIAAGAPEGSGPGDAPPTFVWSTPNDSAIVRTTAAGAITLGWSTADPEGLAVTGTIEVATLQAAADQTAMCGASLTGWAAVTTDVPAGSLPWTAPSPGYYCFRATVSDPAGNATVRTAARPVKYATTPGP